jgi:hypothetical protein
MTDLSTAFVGAVPANYDRYLGPSCFTTTLTIWWRV